MPYVGHVPSPPAIAFLLFFAFQPRDGRCENASTHCDCLWLLFAPSAVRSRERAPLLSSLGGKNPMAVTRFHTLASRILSARPSGGSGVGGLRRGGRAAQAGAAAAGNDPRQARLDPRAAGEPRGTLAGWTLAQCDCGWTKAAMVSGSEEYGLGGRGPVWRGVNTPISKLSVAGQNSPLTRPPSCPHARCRQLPDAAKRARADTVLETGLGDGFVETRAQLSAFLESTVARFPAHWARWLARRPASGVGSAGLGVRCVSFDLDETCWPTTPPIVQVSSGAGLRKRSLTCRHSWDPWTLARSLRHPRLPHLFPTFSPVQGSTSAGGDGGRVPAQRARRRRHLADGLYICDHPGRTATREWRTKAALGGWLRRAKARRGAARACTRRALASGPPRPSSSHPTRLQVSHDLTELRRLALLRLATAHGDSLSAAEADAIIEKFVTARSQVPGHWDPYGGERVGAGGKQLQDVMLNLGLVLPMYGTVATVFPWWPHRAHACALGCSQPRASSFAT